MKKTFEMDRTDVRQKWMKKLIVIVASVLGSIIAAALLYLPTAQSQTTLYQQLGGETGVLAISTELVESARSDPKVSRTFAKINEPRLIKLLAQQICMLSDGGCTYEGESMKVSHAGMGITEAEFAGLVESLREILDRRGISNSAKNELLKRLAPMKRDIVEAPKPETKSETGNKP